MSQTGDHLVELDILGQTYQVRVHGSQEWARKVGGLVDETMRQIQRETRLQETTKVAILAALNLADRLITLQENQAAAAAELQSVSQQVAEALEEALR
jgi:cell division protein ZapA